MNRTVFEANARFCLRETSSTSRIHKILLEQCSLTTTALQSKPHPCFDQLFHVHLKLLELPVLMIMEKLVQLAL